MSASVQNTHAQNTFKTLKNKNKKVYEDCDWKKRESHAILIDREKGFDVLDH